MGIEIGTWTSRRRLLAAALAGMTAWTVAADVMAGPLREARAQRQAAQAEEPGLAGEAWDDGPPSVRGLPPGVALERDLAFGPHPRHRVDVYRPAATAADGSRPLIVMVHGGGWQRGDKAAGGVVDAKVAHWVPRGAVLVSVNYRLVPEADPLGQAEDVARALAWVQAQAPRWRADPSRLVLMGHSAGAHLVSLVASDPAIAEHAGAKRWLATVALDSAAFDVVDIMQARHFGLYDRAWGADRVLWTRGSPLHRLQSTAPPPALLVCSTRRREACDQARGYAQAVRARGGHAELLPVDLSHREINVTLGEPGSYTDRVDAFLRTVGLP